MKTFYPHSLGKKLILIAALLIFASPFLSATKNIKFSVDLSLMVSLGKFNPTTDVMYLRGTFNNWDTNTPLTAVGNNVYSVTVQLADWSYQEYKYCISNPGAANGGWESNFPVASSGNRKLSIGEKDLVLPTVYYNDGEMDKFKTSPHFNIYYSAYDNAFIEEFTARIEKCHALISNAIQSFPTVKTAIYLYKDLDQLHMACGFPENGPSSIGSAWGATLITMLAPSKSSLDDALGLFTHEYTHCLNASKTKVQLPAWLNEGVASYYGRQFSTKDWIKSMMDQQGKPNIADVWNGNMGYAYSGIIAYYIIKTKGEAAMAKFIENMNYSDIGYSNLAALQTDWHAFLDVYLDYQTTVDVKFSVDMAKMMGGNYFKAGTDKVYVQLRGTLSDWSSRQMTLESGTVYSVTVPVNRYNFFEYRFYTNSATAPNGGYELKVDETTLGYRLLDVENLNKTLPVATFQSNAVSGLDMTSINKMIQVLKVNPRTGNTPDFSAFSYAFEVLTAAEYNAQKPTDALPFDCGFVSADGTIHVSAPTTGSQLAVFKDIDKAAVYYLCQAYLYYYYQTTGLPLLLKVGLPAYESRQEPTDAVVKTALNAYGGTLSSFNLLNDPSTFAANNGFAVAHAFGEFMNIFKNWGYPNLLSVTSTGFDAASWWYNTYGLQGLLDDFNRYVQARFLESNEDLRIKKVYESENLRLFTRPIDAAVNFPMLGDSLDAAYKEYSTNYGFKASQKITGLTLGDCTAAWIEGVACDPATLNIGGTAWPSGLQFGCSSKPEKLHDVIHLARHELAHSFEGFMPMGENSQWLLEGFAFFSDAGPLNADFSNNASPGFWKQLAIASLERGTTFFGHRPTYDETKVYPGYETDYGYKYLGYFLCDFIYRKGGYAALKEVMMGDLVGYQKLGFASGQDFMNAFYFDFDVRLRNQNVAVLVSPTLEVDETSSTVNIHWTPLNASIKLDVAVSTDNGTTWTRVAEKTTGTSCSWNAGNLVGKFLVKVSAPDIFNYQNTYGPFNKIDLTRPMLNFPVGNEYLIAGDTVHILWANTTLSTFRIEFSGDDGATWSTVNEGVPASAKMLKWIVPSVFSNCCKIRISDAANALNRDLSRYPFTILKPNELGGPYLNDKNTVLLMHLDNNMSNRSNSADLAIGAVQQLASDETMVAQLGNCYRTTVPLTVPHQANLSLTGDWTIEAWVKPTSFNPNINMYILTKPGDTDAYAANYSLEINPWWGNIFHGFYFSDVNSRNGVSTFALTLNQWYHVAFIRDSKAALTKLLIHDKNRQLVASQSTVSLNSAVFTNTKDLLIGSGLDGYVDEVRISNVIRDLNYSTGLTPVEKDVLSISPNPSDGHVNVHLQSASPNSALSIFNTVGQLVFQQSLSGLPDCSLDLNFLSKGMYVVHLEMEGKQALVSKLMIR